MNLPPLLSMFYARFGRFPYDENEFKGFIKTKIFPGLHNKKVIDYKLSRSVKQR